MMKPISYYWRRPSQYPLLFLAAGVLCAAARTTLAQAEDVPIDLRDRVPIMDSNGRIAPGTLPPWMVDEDGRPIAHRHNVDGSCCKPCVPTKADQDPDVFRRPCFVRGLTRSRETVRAFVNGLTGGPRDGTIKLPADKIPPETIEQIKGLLRTFLHPAYLVGTWEEAQFRGITSYPLKMKSELRNGVPTFVGYEPDLSAKVELRDGNGIQASWAVNGIEVLPYMPYTSEGSPTKSLIRLRIHGKDRLELRRRPPEFRPGGDRMNETWEFFDSAALHELITKVFDVPFESPDQYSIRGHDSEYEGVPVFHGRIRSRNRSAQIRVNRSQLPPHWWDEMRLLVTDSDPQYFCLKIRLGTDDDLVFERP